MMKTTHTTCLAAIALLAFGSLTGAARATEIPDATFRFRQLERDIPSLYLLNGLYLTKEQASKLSSVLDKAYESETRFWKDFNRLMDKSGSDVRKESDEVVRLAASGRPPERAGKRGLQSRRLPEVRREIQDLRVQKQRTQNALADQVYAILTPSQRKTVDGFVPCFIPSSDFRNPERVGQAANDTSFVEKALARLKAAPEERTSEATDRALDALAPYVMEKRHIKYSEEAEQDVRDELAERLGALMPKLRAMSDADFELDKANLANKVFPPSNAEDPAALRWKLGMYLLNTGIRDVVRARAGAAETTSASTRAGRAALGEALDIRKALQAALLIRDLDLTPEQSAKVLEIVRAALAADQKIQKDIAENMAKAFDPYSQLRIELAAGQPSPKAEQEANRAHVRVKMLREETLNQEMLKFQADMDKVLAAKQVDRLAREGKEPGARMPGNVGEMDSLMNRAKRVLSQARRAPALDFAKEKDVLCKNFLDECVAQDGLDAKSIDEQAEIQRGGEVLERARKMDSTEFSQKRDDLAAELCPKRSKPRDPTYGARYVKGKPLAMLSETSKLLFTEEACKILEGLAKK